MAQVDLVLYKGNNFISFPVDMRGEAYEDRIQILFPSNLKDHDAEPDENGEYPFLYNFVVGGGFGLFNVNGTWSGNLNNINPATSYWVNVSSSSDINDPDNPVKVVKTLNGDIFTPHTFSYTLNNGVNWVSYLSSFNVAGEADAREFGSGSYATGGTPDIPFTINPDLLKGSGHANACITKVIAQGFIKQYDGSGSDTSDWVGNLNSFPPMSGYYIITDMANIDGTDSITTTLWTEPDEEETVNLDYIDVSGVTTADSNGNRAFYLHNGYKNDAINFFPLFPFEIQDRSGSVIWQRLSQEEPMKMGACSTDNQLGFVNFDRLYTDSDRPLFGIHGAHLGGTSLLEEFLFEEATCGSMSDQSAHPAMATTAHFGYYAGKNNPALSKFSAMDDTTKGIHSFWMVTTSMNEGILYPAFEGINFHSDTSYYRDIYGSASRICPIIYEAGADDGERFRFTKYYPHPSDMQTTLTGSGVTDFFIHIHPEVFFDSNGERMYSETLGAPYAPAVEKIFPYRYSSRGMEWGGEGTISIYKYWTLKGVLRMM